MGGIAELRVGLATSVGSLPTAELDPAIEMAIATQPDFPTVPTLNSVGATLLAQAVDGLDGVTVEPPGLLRLTAGVEPSPSSGVDLDGPAFEILRRFVDRSSPVHSTTPPGIGVRVGVLGPVSLALALRAAGLPVDRAVELAGTIVARRAVELLAAVRPVAADGVVLVCASEPGLVGAAHPTFPLSPAQVQGLLDPFVAQLDAAGLTEELLIGVHVPGRTDWSTIISSGVSVISAPAEPGLVGSAAAIATFLHDGGRVVWGAVPVDQPLGTGEELLWRRLSALWCDLVGEGLDPLLLRSSSLIGPVDGLGHFGVSQSERVLGLVDALSTRVRRQAIGARLSLGA